jgi:flagellar biosynthesis/type III secretory pathway M-ring protein FliF/YscJ
MMRMKNLNWNRMIKNALRAMPEIPYINERRSSAVLPFVLGALGVAVIGGIAALMVFSPRTRHRALGAAKDAYGKVQDQLGRSRIGEKLGVRPDVSNGLASSEGMSTGL